MRRRATPICGSADDVRDWGAEEARGEGATVAENTANAVADAGTATTRPLPPALPLPPAAARWAFPSATEKLLSPPAFGTRAAEALVVLSAGR
jgi:hypothetical protein